MDNINDVNRMAADLVAHKERDGYTEKLYKSNNYKVISSMAKDQSLMNDIRSRVEQLNSLKNPIKINWADLDDIVKRTSSYMTACEMSGVYPSVMGLAVIGYGTTKQNLYHYLSTHNNETVDFINAVRDLIADIYMNQAMKGNANALIAQFVMKNNHGFRDKMEIEPVISESVKPELNEADLLARYSIEDDTDDDIS